MTANLKGIQYIRCKVRADNQDMALEVIRRQFPGAQSYSCSGQLRNGLWIIEVQP